MARIVFTIVLLSLLLLPCAATAGTTGKIAGKIVDAKSGESLPSASIVLTDIWNGANVSPLKPALGAATDIDGAFFILNLPPGLYNAEVSYVGYKSVRFQKIAVQVDRTTALNASLEPSTLQVSEVVILAQAQGVVKDLTSSSSKVSTEQIQALPVENFTQVLSLQAGITTDKGGGLHVRGGRSSEIQYYVDGMAVSNPLTNGLAVPVENNSIQELEVISGTFNAEYGQALSGIVNIVTKQGSERYEGSITASGGDFLTSRTSLFPHLDTRELRQKYVEANLSGPAPGIGDLNFFVSGRWTSDKNQFYGQRVYNIQDSSDLFNPDPTKWYIETTGDRAWVPMAPSTGYSYLSKFTYKLFSTMKVGYSVLGNRSEFKYYNHREKFNPDYSPTIIGTSTGHLLKIDHTVTPSTFYTLNFSYYNNKQQSYVFEDPADARYASIYKRGNVPAFVFANGGVDPNHRYQQSLTSAVRFDLTSQVSYTHLLKGGFEARYHDVSLNEFMLAVDPALYGDNRPHIPPLTSLQHNSYNKFPVEASGYIQDKIEIKDLIVNLGVRLDYFDPQSNIPTDFADPANKIFPRPAGEAYSKVDPKVQVSPRFGFAFPITERGVIHASYGQFFQIPQFSALYENPEFETVGSFRSYIGNADLEPQSTSMYELGLQQQLAENVFLDVTGFYRDVRHLLGTKLYQTYIAGDAYGRYYNADYGGVRGITVSLDLRPGVGDVLSGSVDYTYQVAKGNGSDPRQAFYDAQGQDESTLILIPLNWDLRHNLASTVTARFESWGASVISQFKTGFPFTPVGFTELQNQERYSSTYTFDLHAYKNIAIDPLRLQLFMRIENIFDAFSQDSEPKVDPRQETAHANNHLTRFNTLYEYYNNPANHPAPRTIKLGVRIEY